MSKKRLLVVVDMQNDFINGVLGTARAQAIVPAVVKKIEAYKANEDYIVYTMDTHAENYLDTQEGKKLPVKHCIYHSEGWSLNPDIAQALKGAKSVDSPEVVEYKKDVFGAWSLGEDVKRWEAAVESLEFVGVCTGICVISNVILVKTALPEMPVIVDAACCACVTPESHITALDAMELLQVEINNR
ncbi:MAG: cysteine hydrolase family protein [Lachnospiraceae bacterium]